jgi:membrane protein DedA with SNARE-associated domain
MELPTHFLLLYGYVVLFAWVLVEQFGVPLPATPVLLAAGALSVDGPIHFGLALAAGVAASLISDSSWFLIGRRHGHLVLRLLCKLSFEPTTWVRRTQDSFGRRRGVMLAFANLFPVWPRWRRRSPGKTAWGLLSSCSMTALAPRSGLECC